MDDSRWATFDCYGTLVDWNAGIATELDSFASPAPYLISSGEKACRCSSGAAALMARHRRG